MNKKRLMLSILLIIIGVVINVSVIRHQNTSEGAEISVKVMMRSDIDDGYQMYYMASDYMTGEVFLEEDSEILSVAYDWEYDVYQYTIPADSAFIRLDFGNQSGHAQVESIELQYKRQTQEISLQQLQGFVDDNELELAIEDSTLFVTMTGADAYLVWSTADWDLSGLVERGSSDFWHILLKIIACVAVDLILVILIRSMKEILEIPREIIQERKQIMHLAKNDFKTRYAASYLGIFWAFVQPIVTVLVYWFVFDKGLKAGSQAVGTLEVPFVLFLISGMVPWFFFNDAINGATNALTSYSYLVKNVVFKISILPVVKVISAVFVHAFFIVFCIIIFFVYGYHPTIYMVQMLYYTASMFIFVLGLGYLTSAINVFFRDLAEIISIILQVWVWFTPIMWNMSAVVKSDILQAVFKCNPLFYIVEGYRDALIEQVWFWQRPGITLYFWCFTLIVGIIGTTAFRKLRVHFADVL